MLVFVTVHFLEHYQWWKLQKTCTCTCPLPASVFVGSQFYTGLGLSVYTKGGDSPVWPGIRGEGCHSRPMKLRNLSLKKTLEWAKRMKSALKLKNLSPDIAHSVGWHGWAQGKKKKTWGEDIRRLWCRCPPEAEENSIFYTLKKNKQNSGENWRLHIPEKVNHHLNLNQCFTVQDFSPTWPTSATTPRRQ